MSSDESGVLYTGTVYFPTGAGNPPVTQHVDPAVAPLLQWSDVNFQFRLRAWREVSPDVQTAVQTIGGIANSLQSLSDTFGSGGTSSSGSYWA